MQTCKSARLAPRLETYSIVLISQQKIKRHSRAIMPIQTTFFNWNHRHTFLQASTFLGNSKKCGFAATTCEERTASAKRNILSEQPVYKSNQLRCRQVFQSLPSFFAFPAALRISFRHFLITGLCKFLLKVEHYDSEVEYQYDRQQSTFRWSLHSSHFAYFRFLLKTTGQPVLHWPLNIEPNYVSY